MAQPDEIRTPVGSALLVVERSMREAPLGIAPLTGSSLINSADYDTTPALPLRT
jgi:hypothetical protein